jgi:predicted KAP-like P-loop ATPase
MVEQLTKEHFDQTLTRLYKKFDAKIDEQTKELKAFAVEQADAVGRIITNAALEDRKFLEEKLDVRKRVEKLEKSIEEIRGALHLSTS